MDNKPIENSVKNLQQLYTVAIGLSLAYAIEQIINLKSTDIVPIFFDYLPNFFSYLVLVIPVFHGAMRHLDISYIENDNPNSTSLIFDFIILFLEGCFFLLLAGVIANYIGFLVIVIILLGIDVIWAIIAYFGFSTDSTEKKSILIWAILNFFVAAIYSIGLIIYSSIPKTIVIDEIKIAIIALIIMLIRSLLDYLLCWNLYYPSLKKSKEKS